MKDSFFFSVSTYSSRFGLIWAKFIYEFSDEVINEGIMLISLESDSFTTIFFLWVNSSSELEFEYSEILKSCYFSGADGFS